MMPSAVFIPAIALQTKFHSRKFLRKLGSMPKTRFVDLEKAYDRLPREKL